jgi:DNA primase
VGAPGGAGAAQIRDGETKAQYLADWRSRFDARFPPPPPGLTDEDMLPDGRSRTFPIGGEAAQARLRSVAAAWLERNDAPDPVWAPGAKAGRWAWELGRRVRAGLIDEKRRPRMRGDRSKRAADVPDASADLRISAIVRHRPQARLRSRPMLTDMRCAGFERTDMGNAERWHARFGEDYLYTTAKGWLGWDGRRYRVLNQEKDTTPAEVLASVFETVRAIQDEARFRARRPAGPRTRRSSPTCSAVEEDPRRPAAWTG